MHHQVWTVQSNRLFSYLILRTVSLGLPSCTWDKDAMRRPTAVLSSLTNRTVGDISRILRTSFCFGISVAACFSSALSSSVNFPRYLLSFVSLAIGWLEHRHLRWNLEIIRVAYDKVMGHSSPDPSFIGQSMSNYLTVTGCGVVLNE